MSFPTRRRDNTVASTGETLHVFSIGHSTRAIDELIRLLLTHKVKALLDVRSFPRSYTNSQFNNDRMGAELSKYQIEYVWLQKLGGRRKGFGNKSMNTCWKNKSFRNYADYMETPEFRKGIEQLVELAKKNTVAIMCAEAVYWRCHRCMIADFLKSNGIQVTHILNEWHTREHEYTECAKIIDRELTYH